MPINLTGKLALLESILSNAKAKNHSKESDDSSQMPIISVLYQPRDIPEDFCEQKQVLRKICGQILMDYMAIDQINAYYPVINDVLTEAMADNQSAFMYQAGIKTHRHGFPQRDFPGILTGDIARQAKEQIVGFEPAQLVVDYMDIDRHVDRSTSGGIDEFGLI